MRSGGEFVRGDGAGQPRNLENFLIRRARDLDLDKLESSDQRQPARSTAETPQLEQKEMQWN